MLSASKATIFANNHLFCSLQMYLCVCLCCINISASTFIPHQLFPSNVWNLVAIWWWKGLATNEFLSIFNKWLRHEFHILHWYFHTTSLIYTKTLRHHSGVVRLRVPKGDVFGRERCQQFHWFVNRMDGIKSIV